MINKINVSTVVNKLSYGYVGFNILKELKKLNIDTAFFPIHPNIEIDDGNDGQWISDFYNRGKLSGGYKDAPSIRLFHQFDLHLHPFCSERYGFPIFELDEFNEMEQNHINGCDKIIVCSKWAKEIVINTTNKKDDEVFVVPLGIDTEIFKHQPIRLFNNKTIFLTVGKIEIRKLTDILPTIFSSAFTQDDDVELWVSFENIFLPQEEKEKWIQLYKTSPLGNKIKIIPKLNTQKDIANLINQCDIMVQLSRAEGWNLPALEACACGKQVIATDYSGSTEFLNKDNANLVQITDKEIAYDGQFFQSNIGSWAKFEKNQIDEAVEHMKRLYKENQEGKDITNHNGIKTAAEFSWTNSVSKLINIL